MKIYKYLISSLTQACRYVNDSVRMRLPIRKSLLQLLLSKIESTFLEEKSQPYFCSFYSALMLTLYYGLFRVSEVTSGTSGSHPILARDVHIGENKDKLLFILRTSKTHWKDSKPQMVKISREGTGGRYCPFRAIRTYLSVRCKFRLPNEPFFVFADRTLVLVTHFRNVLRDMIEICQLDSSMYGTHSFRVRRSVDLFYKSNLSVACIKKLGWWKSNIVYKYLSGT